MVCASPTEANSARRLCVHAFCFVLLAIATGQAAPSNARVGEQDESRRPLSTDASRITVGVRPTVTLDVDGYVTGFVVSPVVNSRAFAIRRVTGINVGLLVASSWSEIVTALMGLFVLRRLWQALTRWRTAGVPHCRRCNYVLTGIRNAARCPECGAHLSGRNRSVGRGSSFDLVTGTVLLACVLATYYFGLRHLPGPSKLPRQCEIWSVALYEFAAGHNLEWLFKWADERSVVVSVNLSAGSMKRLWRAPQGHELTSVASSGDGASLFLLQDHGGGGKLLQISSESGDLLWERQLSVGRGAYLVGPVVGQDPPYVVSSEYGQLVEVCRHGDSHNVIAKINFAKEPIAAGVSMKRPIVVAVPKTEGGVIVAEYEGEASIRRGEQVVVTYHLYRVWAIVSKEQRPVQLGESLPIARLAASPRAGYATVHGRGLLAWELDSAEAGYTVVAGEADQPMYDVAISTDGRYLSAVQSEDLIDYTARVFDLVLGRFVEHYAVPAGTRVESVNFVADGRRLAAFCLVRGARRSRIAVWERDHGEVSVPKTPCGTK